MHNADKIPRAAVGTMENTRTPSFPAGVAVVEAIRENAKHFSYSIEKRLRKLFGLCETHEVAQVKPQLDTSHCRTTLREIVRN